MRRSSGILPAIKKSTRRGRSLGPIVATDYAAPMVASQTAHSSAGPRCCTRSGGLSRLGYPAHFSGSVAFLCRLEECFVIADRNRAVRRRLWQRDANAATGRPARVLRARCAAAARANNRHRPERLRACSSDAQAGARIWSVGSGCVRRWCRNWDIHRCRARPGHSDLRISTRRKSTTLSDLVTMSKSSARAERKRTVRLVFRAINECERLAHPVRSSPASATDRSPR